MRLFWIAIRPAVSGTLNMSASDPYQTSAAASLHLDAAA
jgi:hypothetical protein